VFIGHFAIGFASKRLAPKTSAGTLVLAPLFLDVLWPLFLASGLESVRIEPGNTAFTPLDLHDYHYSHSLLTSVGWSLLFAAVYLAITRYRRGTAVLGVGVFSHWLLDFVTHRPDMPLYPGSATYVGLGLWHSRVGTLLVEGALFVAGVAIYARTTGPRDRRGLFGFWSLVAVLLLAYLAAAFGPPPPSVKAIIIGGLLGWLFIFWAWWMDRHRQVMTPRSFTQ
jgi:membrane-bound metal-dependent hydrolase YbcI (DUF457 family)